MNFLECINCKSEHPMDEMLYNCKKCGDLLEVKLDLEDLKRKLEKVDWKRRSISVWKYREFLPISDESNIITLQEGGTPLYKCERLAERLGIKNLYVKNEGANPTGSFKDRGMTVGVSKALEFNVKTVICASTGNTSASLAAYAARAGLNCVVLIPHGKIALGKLSQAMMYGAKVVAVKGNFDIALKIVVNASKTFGLYLLNSINPFRIEGQKTAAFEICEQLGWKAPDRIIIPVGNAGNITAYWKGFKELEAIEIIKELPRMTGVQASGASPIVNAFANGNEGIEPVSDPETIATAIRIGNPVNWKRALKAIRESGGVAVTVTDDEIIYAQKLLARTEGIFVEPASAASIAGLKKLIESGEIGSEETVVCIATGHGLKDPEAAIKACEKIVEIEPSLEELKRVLKTWI
ncbi:MAG: threonine synthase [archaeon GB-1867-005]|nr:threonine synthase [Candidatus Culexmicrobium cathedralense]